MRMLTPVDYWRSTVLFGAMLVEAQMVIAMRVMGGAGFWNVDGFENVRMVAEKASAFVEAGHAATASIWSARGPGATSLAVLKPIRKRTQSNVRRLGRRGPKLRIGA